jgi:hypothetical protein
MISSVSTRSKNILKTMVFRSGYDIEE